MRWLFPNHKNSIQLLRLFVFRGRYYYRNVWIGESFACLPGAVYVRVKLCVYIFRLQSQNVHTSTGRCKPSFLSMAFECSMCLCLCVCIHIFTIVFIPAIAFCMYSVSLMFYTNAVATSFTFSVSHSRLLSCPLHRPTLAYATHLT